MASPTPPPGRPDPDSVAARLKQQFGDQLDPTLPLDPEPAPDRDAPSSLFDKLRGAGTRGTRYKLLGEVARGGMGVILKIWDDELRRTLAMKVVLGRGDDSKGDTPHVDPKTLGRFLEEAQVTGQLDHPGIVPVHELGLGADGRVYFTMRLVKGEDLRSIFEKVRTGEEGWNQVRALGVMLKVCEAMSYAHSKKVVHRDLKPANVMVGKFGEVYVMDWGLARVLGREDKHDLRIQPQPTTQSVVKTERRERREETPDSPLVTMDGDIVGTPSYMPPEQAKGQLDKLGPHSDVYSLGAMLYQLLTGEMPYVPAGAKVSQHTILNAVLHGPPDPIESLAPKTPPELVAICEMAMARDVSGRYADTQAFASDMRAYLEGRVVRAYEAGSWAESKKWVRRNRPLAVSLASAVVILLGGVVTSTVFASRESEKAAALKNANTTILSKSSEIQLKNAELEQKNAALSSAEGRAQDIARQMDLKAEEALRLRDEALVQARELRVRGLIQDLAQFETLDDSRIFARSQKRPAYEWWLAGAHRLVDGVEEDVAKARRWSPGLPDVEALLAKLRKRAIPEHAASGLENQATLLAKLTAVPLDAKWNQLLFPRLFWRFAESDDQWWHDQLTRLVEDMRRLKDRIAVAERSVKTPEAEARWNEAIAAIAASPNYGGLLITPQVGLLPIGADLASGLQEFSHLETGEPASRAADGTIVMEPTIGLVFVLIPGGRVPTEEVVDPQTRLQDFDLTKVDVPAHFVSKYELTNGQWGRLGGWDRIGGLKGDPLFPATGISWDDCRVTLSSSTAWLCLPTEVQWEYACRGGTTTPWWTGMNADSLLNAADVQFTETPDQTPLLRRVGLLRANPFGLCDVHDNAWEWCLDLYPADGAMQQSRYRFIGERADERLLCGGYDWVDGVFARSGSRLELAPSARDGGLGLRPVRAITP